MCEGMVTQESRGRLISVLPWAPVWSTIIESVRPPSAEPVCSCFLAAPDSPVRRAVRGGLAQVDVAVEGAVGPNVGARGRQEQHADQEGHRPSDPAAPAGGW